jgi:PadR family transcriptional regulator PadR
MASKEPRLSTQTLKVLGTLMTAPQTGLSGAQLGAETKLPSGTLYPILLRLEQSEWLSSEWEDGDPHVLGRPRRRFYTVTEVGREKVLAAYREIYDQAKRLDGWG